MTFSGSKNKSFCTRSNILQDKNNFSSFYAEHSDLIKEISILCRSGGGATFTSKISVWSECVRLMLLDQVSLASPILTGWINLKMSAVCSMFILSLPTLYNKNRYLYIRLCLTWMCHPWIVSCEFKVEQIQIFQIISSVKYRGITKIGCGLIERWWELDPIQF